MAARWMTTIWRARERMRLQLDLLLDYASNVALYPRIPGLFPKA